MTESNDASILWHRAPESGPDVDQLLHPSCFYARPADVVSDEELTIEERRAILSSWASDACAVESNPLLRQPPCAPEPVTFEEIMDALSELDRINRKREEKRTQKPLCSSEFAPLPASIDRPWWSQLRRNLMQEFRQEGVVIRRQGHQTACIMLAETHGKMRPARESKLP